MHETSRQELGKTQRWVIKIGSAMITNQGRGLDLEMIGAWAEQMAALHRQGKQ